MTDSVNAAADIRVEEWVIDATLTNAIKFATAKRARLPNRREHITLYVQITIKSTGKDNLSESQTLRGAYPALYNFTNHCIWPAQLLCHFFRLKFA